MSNRNEAGEAKAPSHRHREANATAPVLDSTCGIVVTARMPDEEPTLLSRRQFKTPSKETVIWRYMNLPKFEKLIRSRGLWFAVANSFSDKFEGMKCESQIRTRDALWDEVGVPQEHRDTIRSITNWDRQVSFINCWMMNTHESELMWRGYANNGGVAIESTYGQLRGALPKWIWIHEVDYIEYETDPMIEWHSLAPFFYKRKEFSQELELRAVIEAFPVGDVRRMSGLVKGHTINIDLELVINRVILSPSPSPNVSSQVMALVGPLGIPLSRSRLDKLPRL